MRNTWNYTGFGARLLKSLQQVLLWYPSTAVISPNIIYYLIGLSRVSGIDMKHYDFKINVSCILIYLCVLGVCVHVHAIAHVWWPKKKILESVFLFFHVGSKDGIQACPQVKCLHPLSDLASLQDINFKSSISSEIENSHFSVGKNESTATPL